MQTGRRKKRYGPARKRGIYWKKLIKIRKVRAGNLGRSRRLTKNATIEALHYIIRAGKPIWVRKLTGDSEWTPHVMRQDVICHGFLWRDRSHHGFAFREWELKVPNNLFEVLEDLPSPMRPS